MDTKLPMVKRSVGPLSINCSPLTFGAALEHPPRRPIGPNSPPLQSEFARLGPPTLSSTITHTKPPAPKIRLQIHFSSSTGPLFESYAGGPNDPSPVANPILDQKTIQPQSTISQRGTQKFGESFDTLRTLVKMDLDKDFEEICALGEGTGGTVYKVRDRKTGIVMARKTISVLEVPIKQLHRELSIAASVNHTNIIDWYSSYLVPSSGEIKIIMEFCEGGSLESVNRRIKERGGVVEEKIAGRLAEGILQGLAYLNAKNTIHRDVKPSNILLSRDGVVKLCDFGVSCQLMNSYAVTPTGTTFYMAPERICGHEYGIQSDVWSTGISILELVQNNFPFPTNLLPIELMMHIKREQLPQLEDQPGAQWSAKMKDFVKQTLIIDGLMRPVPKDILGHPWIVTIMNQEVHMARWIRQVWGWQYD